MKIDDITDERIKDPRFRVNLSYHDLLDALAVAITALRGEAHWSADARRALDTEIGP